MAHRVSSLAVSTMLALAGTVVVLPVPAGAASSHAVRRSASAEIRPVGNLPLQSLTSSAARSGTQPRHVQALYPASPAALREAKLRAARAAQPSHGSTRKSAVPPSPARVAAGPAAGLSATDEGNCCTPPDSTGAIGPNNYVEMVNLLVGVYDRNLTLISSASLSNFAGVPSGLNISDPQVEWDPQANRWFYALTGFSFPTPGTNYLLLGWSKTADPTDVANGWCRFGVFAGNNLQDYPKLGHDNSYLIFGTNVYDDRQPGPPFVTAQIWALPKPALGDASCAVSGQFTYFADATHLLRNADGSPAFTPVPANTADSSTNGYILAAHTPTLAPLGPQTRIMAWHLANVSGAPVLMSDGEMAVNAFDVPASVPQPGASLDSLDARLTQAVAHADPDAGGAEAVWSQHTIAGPGGRSVVRWYELLPGTLTVRQQGEVGSPTDFVFNGAISPSIAGNDAAVFYSRGSASVLPVIGNVTRSSATPLNQMDAAETVLGTSSAADGDLSCSAPYGPPCRWGDYSGATPDPATSGVVWGSNQLNGPAFFGFPQWTTRNFAVSTSVAAWSASYSAGNTPTTWAANQTQTYGVTITNTGTQTWPSGVPNPVRLGVHFANTGGGQGNNTWYTDQRFDLPADLAPAASVTLTIAVTSPANGGSMVLEYQMTRDGLFWFGQFADVSVQVAVPAPWQASYSVGNTPATWVANETKTYGISLTNTGTQSWPAGGANPVHLGVHFSSTGGGYGTGTWYTDQRITLPADVASGGSVTLTINVTAPNNSGSVFLEYQMVKEGQFWFGQFGDVSVQVAAPIWSAAYTVGNTPTSWSTGQTQTYAVTLTNTGNQSWPAGGGNPVHLGVHFANTGGGFGHGTWYTDQRITLPADVAAGSSVTVSIAVTAPTSSGGKLLVGNLVLGYQMVKEQQFWFGQFADVSVTVTSPYKAAYNAGNTPTSWRAGQTKTYTVTLTNTGTQSWPAGGGNPVRLGVHFANPGGGFGTSVWYTDQRFKLPSNVAPGASVKVTISVTAPATKGNMVLEYQMVKEGQFWFSQFADVNVSVS